jgi:hypothetical protein
MGESTKANDATPVALGFLTVVEHEPTGLVGGYLVLNTSGRPLEFHCTAPVKPSRAQQILFGPTLAPYLYGEQIAQALIGKSGIDPLVVWTDQAPVLAVREFVSPPVALLIAGDRTIEDAKLHFDTLAEFAVGRHRVAIVDGHAEDRNRIMERMSVLSTFDLLEPFGRIREAVEEAQRAASSRQAA